MNTLYGEIMRIYQEWEKSKNFFIDGTFHHPEDFKQLMLIMYKDIITGLKIPGLYILLNSKKETFYNYAFKEINSS